MKIVYINIQAQFKDLLQCDQPGAHSTCGWLASSRDSRVHRGRNYPTAGGAYLGHQPHPAGEVHLWTIPEGYNGNPSLIEVIVYPLYLALALGSYFRPIKVSKKSGTQLNQSET